MASNAASPHQLLTEGYLMTTKAEDIAARQAAPEVPHEPDAEWPDPRSRRIFEARMLGYHAEQLERRYPDTIWPSSGRVAGTEQTIHAAQAAFVAGIRFAAAQLHDAASELNDQVYALEEAAGGAS